jgi:hypothetical protein
MTAPTIEVIHGDALDLPFEVVSTCDGIITDPPYADHVHGNTAANPLGAAGRGALTRELGFAPLTPALRDHIAMLASAVKRWSIVFSDHEGTAAWRDAMRAAGVEYIREQSWIRWSQPQVTGDRPCQGSESVLMFHALTPPGPRGGVPQPIAKHWNGAGGRYCYDSRKVRAAIKHPAEKPLDLALDLVCEFSDVGETVLDPCAGRGTIALACRLLGRGCVACETDSVWHCEARMRVDGPLDARDIERATEWADRVEAEARAVPNDTEHPGACIRATARLCDVDRLRAAIRVLA